MIDGVENINPLTKKFYCPSMIFSIIFEETLVSLSHKFRGFFGMSVRVVDMAHVGSPNAALSLLHDIDSHQAR